MVIHTIDRLRKSTVKILHPGKEKVAGSGFFIRNDGYLITCHHVIFHLPELKVEYQGQEYQAQWCAEYSRPEVDIAVLKIAVKDAPAVKIINPSQLNKPVTVYGFPGKKEKNFPQGFDFVASNIAPSAPINTLSTFRDWKIKTAHPWNQLPSETAFFHSHRINATVDPGTSGGQVFVPDLGGVVGVIQCSKSDESYVIRWDNILDILDKLGLEPQKQAVYQFLGEIVEIVEQYQYLKLFHTRNRIILKEQYIPIQVTLERRYRHEVETTWGYSESEAELKKAYSLKGMVEETKKTQVNWAEAKKSHKKIMVLADPGMGKSTLLRREALVVAQEQRKKLENQETTVSEVVFPLLFRLSELAAREGEIFDIILQLLQRDYRYTYPAVAHLLEDKLAKGECLLLLDALDEVPKEQRLGLAEKLNRFAKHYPCSIICTSRIVGYGGSLVTGQKDVEIVPFNQQQTEDYIETWFKNAAEHLEDDSVSASGLIEELRQKPQISGLAQNPLLLSLLCSLYQEKGITLPAKRGQVYEKAVEYMLSQWRKDNRRLGAESGWVVAKTELLEFLAYQFSCQSQEVFELRELRSQIEEFLRGNCDSDFRNVTARELIRELIRELTEEDGIIQQLDREGKKYLFLHRTFQEYLTAAYLNHSDNGLVLAKEHFWDFDWHETLTLLAGLMDDPLPLLQAIMGEKDDIFRTLLLLAGRCVAEGKEVEDALVERIVEDVYQFWLAYPDAEFINSVVVSLGQGNGQMLKWLQVALDDSYSSIRKIAAKALGKIGNTQAVEFLIAALGHSDSDIRSYATDSLSKIDEKILTTALRDDDSKVRKGAVEALEKIGNAKAVKALVFALRDEDSEVRSNAVEALGNIGNYKAVKALVFALRDSRSLVRSNTAEALGKIGDAQAVKPLIAALRDADKLVRSHAAEALGKIGDAQAVKPLIAALYDPHNDPDNTNKQESILESIIKIDPRNSAAVALGMIGSSQAEEVLIAAFHNSGINIEYVIEALRKIGHNRAVEALIAALDDPDEDIRCYAASGLSEITNVKAVKALKSALRHSNSNVRMCAVEALGNICNAHQNDQEVVKPLITALNDSDSEVKERAAKVLGNIGNAQAVKPLIIALNDSDSEVRRKAAEALGNIGNAQAVKSLIIALDDPYRWTRWNAAKALAKIGNTQAVDSLIVALDNYDSNIRQYAIKLLSKIGSAKAVEALITALDSFDSGVRGTAAEALGKIGSSRAAEVLIDAVDDPDSQVRKSAVEALGKIGHSRATEVLIDAVDDPDSQVRKSAVEALGKIGHSRAAEVLIDAVDDPDSQVRKSAVEALGKIGDIKTLEKLIELPQINIYHPQIFSIARTLAVRYSREKANFIPVYREEKVRPSPLIVRIKQFLRKLTIFLYHFAKKVLCQLWRKIKQAITSKH